MATAERAEIADRLAARLRPLSVTRNVLDHSYYDGGLRFHVTLRSPDGRDTILIDGGVFRWVARLISNRRAVFVASGLGTQLVPVRFRTTDA